MRVAMEADAMQRDTQTFALLWGNRGFFPSSLIAQARLDLTEALIRLGHGVLALDASLTRYGAVETPQEGAIYAEFLRQHRGEFDGVILSLPNFGDENGAVAALSEVQVPILIQAYPDELEKMAPAQRRDAFCGKFSIMDIFRQHGIPFTALQPHVVHPQSSDFTANIDHFSRLCRVVKGMRRLVVGAVGARTTPFKTVRIDELALQRHGITVETFDLADVFRRVAALPDDALEVKKRREALQQYTRWEGVPTTALQALAKLEAVLDTIIADGGLDAIALRCWPEIQEQLGVSPCVLAGEMGDRGITCSCETDIGSALTMQALRLASGESAACFDWNNNYGDDDDKCIIFHCGPIPQSMMKEKGLITDHAILANTLGEGCSYGCNTGRLAPSPMTFGNALTEAGRIRCYLGQGRITDDSIPPEYFGCAGVAQIADLESVLQTIGYQGHRHHVAVTHGHVLAPLREAFERYLGYEVTVV